MTCNHKDAYTHTIEAKIDGYRRELEDGNVRFNSLREEALAGKLSQTAEMNEKNNDLKNAKGALEELKHQH